MLTAELEEGTELIWMNGTGPQAQMERVVVTIRAFAHDPPVEYTDGSRISPWRAAASVKPSQWLVQDAAGIDAEMLGIAMAREEGYA